MAAAVKPVNSDVSVCKKSLGADQVLLKSVATKSRERRREVYGEEKEAIGFGSADTPESDIGSGLELNDDPEANAKRKAIHRSKTRRSSFGGAVNAEAHQDMMGALMRARTKMYDNKNNEVESDHDDDDDDDSTEDDKDATTTSQGKKPINSGAVTLSPSGARQKLIRQDQQNLQSVVQSSPWKQRENATKLTVERKDTRSVTAGATPATSIAAETVAAECSAGAQRKAASRTGPRSTSKPPIAPYPPPAPSTPIAAAVPVISSKVSAAERSPIVTSAAATKGASAATPVVAVSKVALPIPKGAGADVAPVAVSPSRNSSAVSTDIESRRLTVSKKPEDDVKRAVAERNSGGPQAAPGIKLAQNVPRVAATSAAPVSPTSPVKLPPPMAPMSAPPSEYKTPPSSVVLPPMAPVSAPPTEAKTPTSSFISLSPTESKTSERRSRSRLHRKSGSRAQSLGPEKEDDEKQSKTGTFHSASRKQSPFSPWARNHTDQQNSNQAPESLRLRVRQRLHSMTDKNRLTRRSSSSTPIA
eukprot:Lankesteria_metandrocarpae@DN4689_c0_g1_i1.p1